MEDQSANASARLVVIGSSAGGVEALSGLSATLPIPFPAPIVIAQHLDPSVTSHLETISSYAQRRSPFERSPMKHPSKTASSTSFQPNATSQFRITVRPPHALRDPAYWAAIWPAVIQGVGTPSASENGT